MTSLIRVKMNRLADSFADLKVRLRMAIASELAQLVAEAVGDVVRTLVAGGTAIAIAAPAPHANHQDDDPWNEDEESEPDVQIPADRSAETDSEPSPTPYALSAPVAVAAAVHVTRWCLQQQSHILTALGAGLGIGLLGLSGSTLVRSAMTVFTAVADLLAVAHFPQTSIRPSDLP